MALPGDRWEWFWDLPGHPWGWFGDLDGGVHKDILWIPPLRSSHIDFPYLEAGSLVVLKQVTADALSNPTLLET